MILHPPRYALSGHFNLANLVGEADQLIVVTGTGLVQGQRSEQSLTALPTFGSPPYMISARTIYFVPPN